MSALARYSRRAVAATATMAMLAAGAVTLAPASSAAVGDITEFALAAGTSPLDVASGPDGNLWVANSGNNTVSKVSTSGTVIASYAMTTAAAAPRAIVAGPDGAMWVALQNANKIARVTVDGAVTEYPIPTNNSQPFDIAVGSDGALWFTELAGNKIGRITTSGAVTEYAVPTAASGPFGITPGPTGSNRLYFTESLKSKVGFIAVTGEVTETVSLAAGSVPQGIAVVSGSVWFAETGSDKLGRLVNDSTVSEIALASAPTHVAPGPSDTMWVSAGNSIIAMNNQGGTTGTYTFANANSQPRGLVLGSDGNMWVALQNRNAIARVATGLVPTSTAAPAITPATGIVPGTALAASNGTWNYASTYAFQWQRCTSTDVTTCAAIGGATASTYTATTTDDKAYLRVGVTASNASGAGQAAYSAVVAVGSTTPAPNPTPTPTPSATGPVASIGGGAEAELVAPTKQKRGTKKSYQVLFTTTQATGLVTFTFTKGSKTKTVTGITVVSGAAVYKWKAPKSWPTGKTTVVATFAPMAGSAYTQAAVTDKVKIIK